MNVLQILTTSILVVLFGESYVPIIIVSGNIEKEVNSKERCLNREGLELEPDVFALMSCLDCYTFMPEAQFKQKNYSLSSEIASSASVDDDKANSEERQRTSIVLSDKWTKIRGQALLTNREGTQQVLANVSDTNSTLLSSFVDKRAIKLWQDCCFAATECCEKMISAKNNKLHQVDTTVAKDGSNLCKSAQEIRNDDDQLDTNIEVEYSSNLRCPPTWDGWQCWEDGGRPGNVEHKECPDYIYFKTFSLEPKGSCRVHTEYAEKECTCDGTWFQKPTRKQHKISSNNVSSLPSPKIITSMTKRRGIDWTDYRKCKKNHLDELERREHIHVGLYIASLVALTPAIAIFFSYKILRVPRIAIHKNLFASLILNGISMVMFKSIILIPYIRKNEVDGPDQDTLIEQNTIGCRWLLMQTQYFRLTSYYWMFCEGYYLHRLLANTFEEQRSLVFILTVGWGFPAVVCFAYAVLRATIPENDTMCWVLPAYSGWIEWIYMLPGLLCIIANLGFFVNIFRILMTKLRAPQSNEPVHYRKAVRATVVLLPLFGLHWLLTLYRPGNEGGGASGGCIWSIVHKYLIVILDGTQGLMVSIVFCYRNGEIRSLLHHTFSRCREYLPSYFHARRDYRGNNTFQMSEYKRQAETCVTQIPECTPLAPAVASNPKNGTSPIIRNRTNGSRMSPSVTVEPSMDSISAAHLQMKTDCVSTIPNIETDEKTTEFSKNSKLPKTEEII